jgi:hypothetical protein
MRTLKYDFMPVKTIITPFPIKSISFSQTGDLIDTLSNLYPNKAGYFRTRNIHCSGIGGWEIECSNMAEFRYRSCQS